MSLTTEVISVHLWRAEKSRLRTESHEHIKRDQDYLPSQIVTPFPENPTPQKQASTPLWISHLAFGRHGVLVQFCV